MDCCCCGCITGVLAVLAAIVAAVAAFLAGLWLAVKILVIGAFLLLLFWLVYRAILAILRSLCIIT